MKTYEAGRAGRSLGYRNGARIASLRVPGTSHSYSSGSLKSPV